MTAQDASRVGPTNPRWTAVGALLRGAMRLALYAGGFAIKSVRRLRAGQTVQAIDARAHSCTIDPGSIATEALFQAASAAGARIVALTGVADDAGVSSVASSLARRCALAGARTLLIDASGRVGAGAGASAVEDRGDHWAYRLLASGGDAYAYRRHDALRAKFDRDFAEFAMIVVDCAPAIESEVYVIPGSIAARSADAAFLVSMGGQAAREQVEQARALLTEANMIGCVVNGRDQPTLGEEIAREAMRLGRIAPGISRRVATRALRSEFLDVRV